MLTISLDASQFCEYDIEACAYLKQMATSEIGRDIKNCICTKLRFFLYLPPRSSFEAVPAHNRNPLSDLDMRVTILRSLIYLNCELNQYFF
jgi:hypothetical protein